MENDLVAELTRATGSQRQALTITGVARSTWQYRQAPRARVLKPIPQKERAYLSRIDSADRAVIETKITAGWKKGNAVDHTFASTWDAGVMLAGRRSWWRIAADIEDQSAHPIVPTRRGSKTPCAKPVLIATGPMHVWSWDITDLHSPWRGKAFKAYSIIDIWSRKIVGFRAEDRESDHLAVDMFETAFREQGTPKFVHADSGPSMRSDALAVLLSGLDVAKTHNRPYVSNDNPYSESEFRTMKYRPNYPGIFDSLESARDHLNDYVPWYNTSHKHSGIALFSPLEVHDGSWRRAHFKRDLALQRYHRTSIQNGSVHDPQPQPQPAPSGSIIVPTKSSKTKPSDSTQLDVDTGNSRSGHDPQLD